MSAKHIYTTRLLLQSQITLYANKIKEYERKLARSQAVYASLDPRPILEVIEPALFKAHRLHVGPLQSKNATLKYINARASVCGFFMQELGYGPVAIVSILKRDHSTITKVGQRHQKLYGVNANYTKAHDLFVSTCKQLLE